MPMSPLYQVIHYIAVVRDEKTGYRFMVLETKDPKYWLFCLLIGETSMMSDHKFPVKKTDVRKDIRQMLNNGAGNSI